MIATSQEEWASEFNHRLCSANEKRPMTLVGVGNPIKSDDSVGLYIARKLRKACGARPRDYVWISPQSSSLEHALSKIANGKQRTVIIFDAVESNLAPGSIIFAGIGQTKYGFFATHDLPLRLVPSIAYNSSNIFVVGVQPSSYEVGEDLSKVVKESADKVVETISKLLKGSR
jgi:hydrogenase maturation protease